MARRPGIAAVANAVLVLLTSAMASAADEMQVRSVPFEALDGWTGDDLDSALRVFRSTCDALPGEVWAPICVAADEATNGRAFFEIFLQPVLIEDGSPPLFTGYYEPELPGRTQPDATFRFPLYRRPPELSDGGLFATREEIETRGLLAGRGLELAWVADPVDAFFMQVQGSGRIRLADGRVLRLGYAGKNGHPYKSVGVELARQGLLAAHQVSAQSIKAWVRARGEAGLAFLRHNPSFVFFRIVSQVGADEGPIGALSRPVTAMRSIAVDPSVVPLGAPVWVEKDGADPLRRLFIAQDTGSAIKGAQRADIFYGSGAEAGAKAGRVRDGGRMLVLLPIPEAQRLLDAFGPVR